MANRVVAKVLRPEILESGERGPFPAWECWRARAGNNPGSPGLHPSLHRCCTAAPLHPRCNRVPIGKQGNALGEGSSAGPWLAWSVDCVAQHVASILRCGGVWMCGRGVGEETRRCTTLNWAMGLGILFEGAGGVAQMESAAWAQAAAGAGLPGPEEGKGRRPQRPACVRPALPRSRARATP